MNVRISTERQRELLAGVADLIRDRAQRAAELTQQRDAALEACQQRYDTDLAALETRFRKDAADLDEAYVQGLERARHHYEVDVAELRESCQQRREASVAKHAESRENAELNWRRTRAMTLDGFESDKKAAQEVTEQTRAALEGYDDQMMWLEQQTQQMLRLRGIRDTNPPPLTMNVGESTAELLKRYTAAANRAHQAHQTVAQWKATRFIDEGWPLLLFFALFFVAVYPCGTWLGWGSWTWLATSGGFAACVAVVSRQAVQWVVRWRAQEPLEKMQAAFADAQHAVARAKVTAEREHELRLQRLQEKNDEALQQADLAWEQIAQDIDRELSATTSAVEQEQNQGERGLELRWEDEARPFKEEFPPRIQARKDQFTEDQSSLRQRWESESAQIRAEYDQGWRTMANAYLTGMSAAGAEFLAMSDFCHAGLPRLTVDSLPHWSPPARPVPALRFGEYEVDLTRFEGGLPDEVELRTQSEYPLPAALAFPDSPSLLIQAHDEGRDRGIDVLRNIMLRMLTSFPAGKVRFTIIDPTGLGQNFSEFMHLADYDERLVSNRIWTEANHINQRLADITEHMENVIQKYLRNEFASIQDYNDKAGEVAEPFQVLVIANFPANFSEETARRLVSIATSGARCGVFTLILCDTKMMLPRNFDLADLEASANTIVWETERFRWQTPDLAAFPLVVDEPMEGTLVTQIIRAAGELAKDANRVEVPFGTVVPDAHDWWTHDSRQELAVPLGRAGATKLQSMRLGKGTSQHVLIAGKTGSGKSTLLHAIITNLSIHYSPREVEFFLVDFKKGVEFKTYAQWGLPHARVIAIESEREFGLSVLERLDEELRNRGDRFREAGVQGVAAFRDKFPDEPMPRQLLIVDEFQEFFVKDDKIAHEASLLLDRLVRQGRAFGIHVLLGSQTLAGAYSLARSTLGQMAVRIALQCSESDAHLILSEDNTAARLLNRPGEAIYNNANGLFEGNHPFQVVWLPDAEHERYLRDLQKLATSRQAALDAPVVFEGNVPPQPAHNGHLRERIEQPPTLHGAATPKAWLGAAVAIKEPTHIVFRRQSGNNLLIVGQKEELAAGILSTAVVGLVAGQPPEGGAAVHPSNTVTDQDEARDSQGGVVEGGRPRRPRRARCLILDGGGFEAEDSGWSVQLARRLPHNVATVGAADVNTTVAELAEEVRRRIDDPASNDAGPPQYLVIYNLARFRDLRKSEDDFGFSSFGSDDAAEASPAQQLALLLKDGPAVGVHVLMWCDTYNNVTRWFDRQHLRDISHRVLFQMSATDSSNLMDAAAASQLGAIRAIYYDDEQGEFERFRPYGLPSRDWMEWVGKQLAGSSAGSGAEYPVDGR